MKKVWLYLHGGIACFRRYIADYILDQTKSNDGLPGLLQNVDPMWHFSNFRNYLWSEVTTMIMSAFVSFPWKLNIFVPLITNRIESKVLTKTKILLQCLIIATYLLFNITAIAMYLCNRKWPCEIIKKVSKILHWFWIVEMLLLECWYPVYLPTERYKKEIEIQSCSHLDLAKRFTTLV